MTNKLIIYEPETTINLVTNPRIADGVDGYFDNGSTILRSLNRSRWGRTSLQVVTDGVGLQEGAYFRFDPQTQNTFYGASVYARGTGIVRARLHDATNGIEFATDRITLDDNHWIRLEVLGRTGGNASNDLRLFVETFGSIQSVTYYTDGWMIEANSYVTTYLDGELEKELPRHDGNAYFRWNGTRNASSSTRSVRFRPAGKPRILEFEDVGVYVTQGSGTGMAPVRLNLQDLGGQNKSLVQNFQAQSRAISLLFWAKKEPQSKVAESASLRELHILRERLEALIKPDRSHGAQPFLLRYVDGPDSLDILAHYESGLEFDGDLRFPYFNSFAVRLLSVEPFWNADGQDVQQLTASSQIANADGVIAKIDGAWQALGTGAVGGNVREFAQSPNGDIYAVGFFTSMGGVSGTRGIARWDGTEWISVGGGLADGTLFDVEIAPDGDVYVGGTFVDCTGEADCNNIARYAPDTDDWHQVGTRDGLNGNVQDLAIDKNGNIYIGGAFTAETGGGGPTLNLIARATAGGDNILGLGGGPGLELSTGGGRVRGLMVDLDGVTVFVVGLFDREPGGSSGDLDGVAIFDFDTNSFTEPGEDGIEGVVADSRSGQETALAPDGKIYIAGFFTNIGVVDAISVAVYTRQDWLPLGQEGDGVLGGISNVARNVKVDAVGRVFYGGDFQRATGADFAKLICTWNGTSFSHLDLELPGAGNDVHGLMLNGKDIYVGHETIGTAAQASAIHTINNRGKASVGVVLECLGPARLLWLENQTTGHVIRMDLTVQDGEIVTIDLREGMQRFVSDFRGNVAEGILPDSDLTGWKLLPGDNVVAFFARDTDSNTEISLRWAIRHWSFDDIVWAQSIA